MYCRSCGNEMPATARVCLECNTPRGEGVDYCHNCGYYTSIKTIHCSSCGAKQRTIITPQMKKTKLDEIKKKLRHHQKMMKIGKVISIISVITIVILSLILVFRPEPDNIPDIEDVYPYSSLSPNTYVHDTFTRVGDVYYYDGNMISEEVAEYWVKGRNLIAFIIMAIFTFICSMIDYLLQKNAYKKTLRKAKEVQ